MVNHLNSTLSEPIPGKVSNVFKGKMSKKLTDALLTLKPKSANVQSKKIEQNNDEQNLKKLCRACAKAKSSLIQIFGVQGQLLNLSSLVEHLGVVHENDELPTKLCLDCVIKLRASHRFYTQFKNAEKQLRTILEFQKELGIDEEVHDDIQEIPSPPPPKKAKSTCKVSVNGSIQEVDLEKIRAEAVCRNPPVQKSTIETKQIQAELLRKDPLTKTTKIQNFEAVSTPIDLPTQELKIEKIRTVTDDEIDNSDNLNCVNSFKDETIKEFDPVSVQDPISENISELPREEIRESTNKVIPESNNVTKRHLASKYVASLKQMKLDLNNPSKIQIAEDGMMYVQVPGPNPNEMLLVKVKKAEKPIPKKTENSGKPAAAMIKAVKKQTKRKRTELIVSEESTGEDLQEELITDELPMPEEGQPPVPKIPKVRYYCDFCFKSYSNAEKLEIHAKNHEIQETYSCDDCDAYFYSPREKRLHNSNCERKLICRYCGEKFKLRAKKSQHEMKHLEAECGRLCFICGVKLKTSNVLDNHVRMVHRRFEPGVFPCPKCPKTFPLRAKLNFHVRTVHVLIRSLLCDQCGSSFKNPGSLRHHKIRKHLDINTRVECTICSKSLLKHSLSRHMLSHRGYTIKCPTCDRMFKQRSTLRQHMRIHDEKRKYKCEVCGVGFNRLDNLRKHKKAVHQKVVKPAPQRENSYRCTICNDKFANSSLLTIHRNAVHQAGQTYICHICNRQMVSSFALDWHLVCIHGQKVPGISDDGAYRLFCFHCGEQLKSEASLMKHVKSEHYEKGPVKCMDCEATFVSEGPFRHHMLSVHKRTEGTLKCPHCDHRAINQNRFVSFFNLRQFVFCLENILDVEVVHFFQFFDQLSFFHKKKTDHQFCYQ